MPHRLVNYRCNNCRNHEEDEIFMPGEKPTKYLKDKKCPKCGGSLEMWNFKNNNSQWEYMDKRK